MVGLGWLPIIRIESRRSAFGPPEVFHFAPSNGHPGEGREPPISMMALKAMDPFCPTIDPGLRRDDSNGMIDSRGRGRAADYVNPTAASAGMTTVVE